MVTGFLFLANSGKALAKKALWASWSAFATVRSVHGPHE